MRGNPFRDRLRGAFFYKTIDATFFSDARMTDSTTDRRIDKPFCLMRFMHFCFRQSLVDTSINSHRLQSCVWGSSWLVLGELSVCLL